MLHYGVTLGDIKTPLNLSIQLDIGFFLLAILLPIYILVDTVTGLVSFAFFSSCYLLSTYLYQNSVSLFGSSDMHFRVMLILHIISWISQFIGHGIFEGRAPALLDNLLLMFVAPFFFVFEVLHMAGYREKEVREWNKVVAREIQQFRQSKI